MVLVFGMSTYTQYSCIYMHMSHDGHMQSESMGGSESERGQMYTQCTWHMQTQCTYTWSHAHTNSHGNMHSQYTCTWNMQTQCTSTKCVCTWVHAHTRARERERERERRVGVRVKESESECEGNGANQAVSQEGNVRLHEQMSVGWCGTICLTTQKKVLILFGNGG